MNMLAVGGMATLERLQPALPLPINLPGPDMAVIRRRCKNGGCLRQAEIAKDVEA